MKTRALDIQTSARISEMSSPLSQAGWTCQQAADLERACLCVYRLSTQGEVCPSIDRHVLSKVPHHRPDGLGFSDSSSPRPLAHTILSIFSPPENVSRIVSEPRKLFLCPRAAWSV